MLCTASILNLCCISLDRYFAITRPLSYSRRRSPKLARTMIALVWIGSVLISCPPVFGWKDENRDTSTCSLNLLLSYRIYSSMGSFFLPAIIMIFVYIRIFKVIHDREKYMMSNSSTGTTFFMSEKSKPKKVKKIKGSNSMKENDTKISIINDNNTKNCFRKCFHKRENSILKVTMQINPRKEIPKPPKEIQVNSINNLSSSSTPIEGETLIKTDNENLQMIEIDDKASEYKKLESGKKSSENFSSSFNEIDPGANRDSLNNKVYKRTHNDSLVASISKTATNKDSNCFCFRRSRNQNRFVFNNKNNEVSGKLRRNLSLKADDSKMKNERSKTCCSMNRAPRKAVYLKPSQNVGLKLSNVSTTSLTLDAKPVDTDSLNNMTSVKFTNRFRHYFRSKSFSPQSDRNSNISTTLNSNEIIPVIKQTSLAMNKPTPNNLVASKLATNSSSNDLNSITTKPLLKKKVSSNSGVSNSSQNLNQRTSLRTFQGKQSNNQEQMKVAKESKSAKTLAIVVGGFILSWLPFFIIYVLEAVVEPGTLSKALFDSITWLGYFNSAINPFIYAFCSKPFRSAFYRLTIGKLRGQRNKNDKLSFSYNTKNSQSNNPNSKNFSARKSVPTFCRI